MIDIIKNTEKSAPKKKKNWHIMPPEQYNEVFEELSTQYPKLFIKDKILLLKVGLHKDIFEEYKLTVTRGAVRRFFKLYTGSKKYRELHIENAIRYDLEGNESGVVSKEHIELAAQRKKDIEKQREAKKTAAFERKKQNNKKGEHKNADQAQEKKPLNSTDSKLKMHGEKPKLGIKR